MKTHSMLQGQQVFVMAGAWEEWPGSRQGPRSSTPYLHAREFGHIHVLDPVIEDFQTGTEWCGQFEF